MQTTVSDKQPRHLGKPGASALRKARHLHERRERLGADQTGVDRLLAALFPPAAEVRLRQEERSWNTGGAGERTLASYLASRCPHVPMLHDRCAPGSRWNIDHVAIAPSGIYVIDCKRYKGRIEVARPLLGSAKLKVDGWDKTDTITSLDRQVARVRSIVVEIAPDVKVDGCLCFVAPAGLFSAQGLPVFRTLRLNGYPLYHPTRLARRLDEPGALGLERALELQARLAERLPEAF